MEGLLRTFGEDEGVAARLDKLAKLKKPTTRGRVPFAPVAASAWAFVTASIARNSGGKTVWVVCPNLRVQETLHAEGEVWHPDVRLFPELSLAGGVSGTADPDIQAERFGILRSLTEEKADTRYGRVILILEESLADEVPKPGSWEGHELRFREGGTLDLAGLPPRLEEAGYERATQVTERGQYAIRGGILDIFSWQMSLPARIELFGDEIESIREFGIHDQISVGRLGECQILLNAEGEEPETCPLTDYIELEQHRVIALEVECEIAHARVSADLVERDSSSLPELAIYDFESVTVREGDPVMGETKRQLFFRRIQDWQSDGWAVTIFCNNRGELDRLQEILVGAGIDVDDLRLELGQISRGFSFPQAKLAVLSDAEIFGRYQRVQSRRVAVRPTRVLAQRAQIDFAELDEGDPVVHADHGIARYRGITEQTFGDGPPREVIELEFDQHSKLYVPLDQSHLVSRYVGLTRKMPKLSSLADQKWSRTKATAQKAVLEYAQKLLKVQAERETGRGYAFEPDTKWQSEFEQAFLFKETPDQITAIAETKRDMEMDTPMERLICGDVGFGKTEVAIRAAFKAVMGGKQVAILVPTTVLAQQHFQTFQERMADWPITVDTLSRFRTPKEQKEVIRKLAEGEIDICVGTHRLISKDVKFKDLGLVVIDEEQRFGVKHKERFKELFSLIDVLTLSATPIPRTLYLSLMGARDMSTIETPPPNRIPVETTICAYDQRVIRDVINREVARQGQVYFLHNRVHDIEKVRDKIAELCPGVRVEIGHGQMDEEQLEEIMHRFVDGKFDVLVCTTIIESGLDIPNANTIIIDRADRFGLADLYQLRGRVGRSNHKAYAYLMLPREMMLGGDASKRIGAIKEFSSLGSGFRIAMRDLEIRGAGNILGTTQSGHVTAVGFDLYCKMLRQAVDRARGKSVRSPMETQLRLDFIVTNESAWRGDDREKTPCFIPSDYMPEATLRIQAYKSLAEASSQKRLKKIEQEWRDRFGKLPQEAENLLTVTAIRLAATHSNIPSVEVKEDKLMLIRNDAYILMDGKFPRLTGYEGAHRLRRILEMLRST